LRYDAGSVGFFWLGFFFGILGIIVAAVASPRAAKPTAGMFAVTCLRCNGITTAPMGPRSDDDQCRP
jgi:hypothetical protein